MYVRMHVEYVRIHVEYVRVHVEYVYVCTWSMCTYARGVCAYTSLSLCKMISSHTCLRMPLSSTKSIVLC